MLLTTELTMRKTGEEDVIPYSPQTADPLSDYARVHVQER